MFKVFLSLFSIGDTVDDSLLRNSGEGYNVSIKSKDTTTRYARHVVKE